MPRFVGWAGSAMRLMVCLVVMSVLAAPVRAQVRAGRSVFQYTHLKWTEETDAPRPAVAVVEDKRGFILVASSPGLFAFDGTGFVPLSSHIDLVRHGPPSALLVRRNGDVWTNFERSGRFAVYRNGWLSFVKAPRAPHRVSMMAEAADGTVWVLTEQIGMPLMRYRKGQWTLFGTAAGAPIDNPFSMVVTLDGTVFLSFTGSIVRLKPNGTRFETVREMPHSLGRLSIDGEDRIWITERGGTYPVTGPGGRGSPPKLRHPYVTDKAEIRGWPRFDREGNLWIATYYDGLQRIAKPDPRGAATAVEAVARVEHFTQRDGLSSNATSQMFQDSEGNVWVATEGGVDRFWPATIRFEPRLTEPAAFGDLLLAASDGSVYIGEAGTIYRVRPGGNPEPILQTKAEPRTLCEAPDKSIWIGVQKKLLLFKDGKVARRLPDVPLDFTIYDCAFDRHGDYWVTAALGGMARYRNGNWARQFGPTGSAFEPKSMVRDSKGILLVHWSDRVLARVDGTVRWSGTIPFGDYDPNDVTIRADAGGQGFVAGRFGLARLKDGRFDSLSARRYRWLSGVNGMVKTKNGDTWLAAPTGLARVASSALGTAFSDPSQTLTPQLFGYADGLKSRPHTHSRQSIVQGGDGRLWIATQMGTVWLDPADIRRRPQAPRAWISMVTADRLYLNPKTLTLPAGTDRFTVNFGVFHYSNPRGAQVRYRLDGLETDWFQSGSLRSATYRYLGPGTYRFRLAVANEDGVWDENAATLDVIIPPTFLQSWMFTTICVIAFVLLLLVLYRLRVAQVGARIRTGMEERLRERERIARELHDTLLQSVQGLVLKFQSVANKLPADGPASARLEDALKRADEVMAEGRNRVQDLRPEQDAGDLAELLQARAREAEFDPVIPIRIVVEGRPREVHPLVAVEVGRIVSEALANVARHAHASSVEISVRYAMRELVVEISDDGMGIAPEVLETGHREGHWGLVGMRERAERLGGKLTLQSEAAIGSVVTMILPARLAFVGHAPRMGFLRKLFGSRLGFAERMGA